MYKGRHVKKSQLQFGSILYWTVGSLLILTMLTTWLLSGFYAKYVTTDNVEDGARVARGGAVYLWEHKAKETGKNSGIYELLEDDDDLVAKNKYKKVLPGVDIPKDPFVRLDLEKAEVDYVLYLEVIKSDPFPDDTVTYGITNVWKYVETKNGGKTDVYVYVGDTDPDSVEDAEPYVFKSQEETEDISIIEDDILYVSEHYYGGDDGFSLTFSAYIRQVD